MLLAASLGAAAQAGADVMFSGNSSGEKPQSKIFECDGSWWCVLDGSQGVAIYEKVGTAWQIGGFADAILTPSGRADVKWTGTHLFVLVYSSSPKLYKYTYDGGLRIFALMAGFPVSLPNPSGSETMVLEQDTTGRLWTTAEGGGNVNVYYSTSADHRTWASTPVVLRSGVGSDDISSIIAFGNKVGVFWSDQNRDEFGFRVHNDTAAPTQWEGLEIADSGPGYADDHINLAYDASGRIFAVTKDDRDRMAVHRRSTSGAWTTRHDITGVNGTRGIIMLSEADRRLYVLFTRWGVSPYSVQYVTADMDALSFQGPTTFITAGSDLNNVTGTKGILPKGNLIGIASASSYHYNAFGSLQSPAPAPQNLVATLQSNPTRVLLAWDAPASGSPSGYNVYRQADGGAFTRLNATPITTRTFTDTAPPSAYVCYHVRAIAGTESAPSNTDCADTRSLPPPGAPLNLNATLGWTSANSPTVALSWDAPITGGAAAGYHVFRSSNGGAMQRLTTALVTSRAYTDTNPGFGQICYQVTAENIEQLAGPASNPACTNIVAALGAPTHVTAIRDEIGSGGGAAAYPMDEGSGGIAADATGSGHTAQLGSAPGADANDPTWVAGASGSALGFDGADYLRIPSAPALEFGGSFTLEAWVRRSVAGSTDCIVAKGGSDVRNYWMMLQADGSVDFRWETTGGTNHGTRSTAIVEVGAWHHVACVYDKAAGQNRIYIDGKLVRAASDSGTPITNTDPVYIGARASGSSLASHFSGAIDLVRLSASAVYTSDFTPALGFGTQPIVRVAWDPPAQGSAAGYRVYRSIAGGLPTPLVTSPLAATSYIDLSPADSACYRVTAIDALARESALSDAACPDGVAPPGAIGPPVSVSATATLVGGGAVGGAAWYAMDEGAGDSTADGSGAGHVAQLGSAVGPDSRDPAWITGVTGSGLDFAGSDYLRVQSTAALKLNGSFTLEAWVYRNLDGTTDCIVSKGDSDRRNYWMMLNTGGNINFRWETSGGSNHGTVSTAKVSLNTWHHVACVYDQTAGQDRIYIDGVLVRSASDSGTPVTNDDAVYIGARLSSGSLTSHFSGGLDLVRISPSAIYTANFAPPTQFGAAQPAVRVSWSAPAGGGAVGYHVYRAASGAFTRINTTLLQETSYLDTSPAGTGCYRVTAVDAAGVESAGADACLGGSTAKTVAAVTTSTPIAARFAVHPNPFNPSTRIVFDLPSKRDVVVELFDVRGRRIATLLRGQCEAGHHSVAWDGRDDHRVEVGSGTYFVCLNAGAFHATQKLTVLK